MNLIAVESTCIITIVSVNGRLQAVRTNFNDTAEYVALLDKAKAMVDGPVDDCSTAL